MKPREVTTPVTQGLRFPGFNQCHCFDVFFKENPGKHRFFLEQIFCVSHFFLGSKIISRCDVLIARLILLDFLAVPRF